MIRLREQLSKEVLDAGAEAVAAHPARETSAGGGRLAVPATSTIWRILSRRGFVSPNRRNGRHPPGNLLRDQPKEPWQADANHWQLADGADVKILKPHRRPPRLQISGDARR